VLKCSLEVNNNDNNMSKDFVVFSEQSQSCVGLPITRLYDAACSVMFS